MHFFFIINGNSTHFADLTTFSITYKTSEIIEPKHFSDFFLIDDVFRSLFVYSVKSDKVLIIINIDSNYSFSETSSVSNFSIYMEYRGLYNASFVKSGSMYGMECIQSFIYLFVYLLSTHFDCLFYYFYCYCLLLRISHRIIKAFLKNTS